MPALGEVVTVARAGERSLRPTALVMAVLASCLLVPALLMVWALLSMATEPSWENVAGAALLGAAAAVVTLAHTVVLGLPVFFWLRHRRALNAWRMALAGFVAGGALVAVTGWPSPWQGEHLGWMPYLKSVALCGTMGLASALAFWFCWLYFQRRASTTDARFPTP